MNPRSKPSPVRTSGRERWGHIVIAGRDVRIWADLIKGRAILQLAGPEPRDLGLVLNGRTSNRPLLVLNPQQWDWAGTAAVRSQLLQLAIDYYNTVFAETASATAQNRGVPT